MQVFATLDQRGRDEAGIRGTRFRVTDLLELLAAGASNGEILADYTFLESDDIRAVLLYAAGLSDHEGLICA